jgi:hypothetical protein
MLCRRDTTSYYTRFTIIIKKKKPKAQAYNAELEMEHLKYIFLYFKTVKLRLILQIFPLFNFYSMRMRLGRVLKGWLTRSG